MVKRFSGALWADRPLRLCAFARRDFHDQPPDGPRSARRFYMIAFIQREEGRRATPLLRR